MPVLRLRALRRNPASPSLWKRVALPPEGDIGAAGDHIDVILKTYAGDFEKAKRNDEIRAKLAAGTSIRLG
jgi:hypothetical protein